MRPFGKGRPDAIKVGCTARIARRMLEWCAVYEDAEFYPDASELYAFDIGRGTPAMRRDWVYKHYYSWRVLVDGYPAANFPEDEDSCLAYLPTLIDVCFENGLRSYDESCGVGEAAYIRAASVGGSSWTVSRLCDAPSPAGTATR